MTIWPSDYVEYVLDDVKKYGNNPERVHASLLERISVKKLDPKELHPNPEDEFSMAEIGPNLEIVSDYCKMIPEVLDRYLIVFKEPIMIEKMKAGGYMILNGHHRWFAALRMNMDKVKVKIVNLVHDEDIERMMDSSENDSRAVFDLDEVLLCAEGDTPADIPYGPMKDKVLGHLRSGVPEVIRALQEKGYDIWVYSGDYHSEGEINMIFELYDLKITGAINGMNGKPAGYSKETEHKLKQKYSRTIHIDRTNMLFTHSDVKGFEDIELEDPSDWKSSVLKVLALES